MLIYEPYIGYCYSACQNYNLVDVRLVVIACLADCGVDRVVPAVPEASGAYSVAVCLHPDEPGNARPAVACCFECPSAGVLPSHAHPPAVVGCPAGVLRARALLVVACCFAAAFAAAYQDARLSAADLLVDAAARAQPVAAGSGNAD